ncbi:MAG: DUF5060 domain-containing protein, partial [Bacteroidota bacterium]|nr:DUF5060 domain-containing protein [Bacteroidota bacterium]
MKGYKLIIIFLFLSSLTYSQKIEKVSASAKKVPQYSKISFNLKVKADFSDPFDQDDIKLDAIVFPNGRDSLIVPGFYVLGDTKNSEWKVRFAARSTGMYSAYFVLTTRSGIVKSRRVHFLVTASDGNGFLTMDKSGFFFKFNSGRKFRGIGTDFGWEARDFENQKFTYDFYFKELAANHGNFTRSWMAPNNLPLEWKKVDSKRYEDDTLRYNTSGMKRMDEVLDLAKQYGIYMMITLDFHGELKTKPNYWGSGDYWSSNLYNVANGGPCKTPADFFSNPIAKKRYKDRLRYFIARWGYSTHLGVIEFWNEVDNAMADENIPPQDIVSWHQEMSDYLKRIDPYHHIMTTSISHRTIPGLFDINNLDFAQAHIYSPKANLAEIIEGLNSKYKKPGVVGEFGYDWRGSPKPAEEGLFIKYFHLGLWRGLFSESPVLPLTWWWQFFITDGQLVELKKISTFSDLITNHSTEAIAPVTVTGDDRIEKLGLKSGQNLFVWLRNQNENEISAVTINVDNYKVSRSIYYMIYDCEKGTFSGTKSLDRVKGSLITLEHLAAQQDIAIYFTTNKTF